MSLNMLCVLTTGAQLIYFRLNHLPRGDGGGRGQLAIEERPGHVCCGLRACANTTQTQGRWLIHSA